MTGAVTFTLIVQPPLAGTVAFSTLINPVPDVAVIVGEPQPEEEALAGLAIVITPGVVGSVSVKFNPLITTEAELVKAKINVDTPPAFVVDRLKLLDMFTAEAGLTIYA